MDLLINLGEPHRLLSRGPGRPDRLYQRAWISGLHEHYLETESPPPSVAHGGPVHARRPYDHSRRSCRRTGERSRRSRSASRPLAAETGVCQKHLIHLCREQVGLPPKRCSRIVRFNSLLRRMAPEARPDWADLAAMYGFCDQAHFVRDFREFTGTTPTDFLRPRGPDGNSVVLG